MSLLSKLIGSLILIGHRLNLFVLGCLLHLANTIVAETLVRRRANSNFQVNRDNSSLCVVLRVDLDVPLTPFVPFRPIEEEFKELLDAKEAEASEAAHRKQKQKKTKKQLEEEAEQWRLYEEAQRARAEPWKTR